MSRFAPDWSADAVWYQVFVPRFCNGTVQNDPPHTLPWTGDWAQLEPGEQPPLRHRLFGRRYGGDLQGLRSKLAYLNSLGVNTLYLNPVFQAPSEHKYDTTDHRHIDDTLGVAGSRLRLTGETHDPSTWRWSASDREFCDFVAAAHTGGFRIVIDGVFNHVGPEFWAWRDVKAIGRDSPYADWFQVTDWGPPIRWEAWDGPNGRLVNFKQVGDGLHPDVEAYLFAAVRRWMDPDGDGDPSDGVDGWRLDAAEKVPHGFWRRFRREVKRINPQALIVGEIWIDAGEWLAGDQFDTVTNYRFSGPVMRFFSQAGKRYAPSAFLDDLAAVRRDHLWEVTLGMLNLLGSHDTDRAVTMLADPQRLRDAAGKIPERDLLVPDEDAYRRLKLAAFLQFTYPGSPIVYYGDEVGMFGGDDPFCRAPMWWSETDHVGYRTDLVDFYRALARARRRHQELRRGRFRMMLADDARRLIAFSRRYRDRETIVVVNGDVTDHRVILTARRGRQVTGATTFCTAPGSRVEAVAWAKKIASDGRLTLFCPGLSGQLLVLGPWGGESANRDSR